MSRPDRTTPGGRAYLDLQNAARSLRRPTQELLVMYAVERWLARLVASPHANNVILKGGMLLAAIDLRRPTVDADALVRGMAGDADTIAAMVRDVCATPSPDDGIEFDVAGLTTRAIREEGQYQGTRVTFTAKLATARISVVLDINVGDPVTPDPQWVDLPSVRPGTPATRLLGYPLETVLAEKITTAMELGALNSRMKDLADIWTLTGRHDLNHASAQAALQATAAFRKAEPRPMADLSAAIVAQRASAWTAYRRSLGVDGDHLPTGLASALADIATFSDHLLQPSPTVSVWDARVRAWRP